MREAWLACTREIATRNQEDDRRKPNEPYTSSLKREAYTGCSMQGDRMSADVHNHPSDFQCSGLRNGIPLILPHEARNLLSVAGQNKRSLSMPVLKREITWTHLDTGQLHPTYLPGIRTKYTYVFC